jgi:FAD dependent oxidoreductase TIGR03364
MGQRPVGESFDLAIVGGGIVGLGTALAAVRCGLRVVVIDRDAQPNGASVRNFGFVTLTGQQPGLMWERARRTRELWCEVCGAAGIPIAHTGMWMTARRTEAVAVMEAFMATDMAAGCRILTAVEARHRCPQLLAPELLAVLESSLELRVESRQAIPRLGAWLAEAHGVHFIRGSRVAAIEPPWAHMDGARVRAERFAVCPGDEYHGLYAARLAQHALTRCKLQMLRLDDPGFRLPATLMSELGMTRNAGYAMLGPTVQLKERLMREQAEHLEHGVHLIVVQDLDGSLIVGDSHQYTATPDATAHAEVEALILAEFRAALGIEPPPIRERWLGTYAYAPDRSVLIDAPEPSVRLAIVTCGAGASTAFAIGEELVGSLFKAAIGAGRTHQGSE